MRAELELEEVAAGAMFHWAKLIRGWLSQKLANGSLNVLDRRR